jgi:NAD(P)-dependent dehydrogenase (short-subunit alcohol dehydrogenase family)
MQNDRLTDARVLVTGGSSETGPFICREFLAAGAHLWTTWFSNEQGAIALQDAPRPDSTRDFRTSHLDIMDQASIDRLILDVCETWPRLDVLILCCGSKGLRPFRPLSREQLDTAIDGNIKGNFMLAKELGYWMKATKGLGKIIQLTAMSAENTSHSAYGLAKAGQNAMGDFLAFHLAPEATVNTIAPITIDQDDAHETAPPDAGPLGRQIHAREIARMCRLLCDPAFDTVTGQLIRMDAGRRVASAFPKEL